MIRWGRAVGGNRAGELKAWPFSKDPALTSNNLFWTYNNCVRTGGQADPFGGTTAALVTDNATSASHYASLVYTSAGIGTLVEFSVYVLPGTYTGNLCVQGGAGAAFTLNWSTSSHLVVSGSASGLGVLAVGGGWYQLYGWFIETSAGAGTFAVGFNTNLGAYVGTSQTFTLYSPTMQFYLNP
jgi:hypothetical protein